MLLMHAQSFGLVIVETHYVAFQTLQHSKGRRRLVRCVVTMLRQAELLLRNLKKDLGVFRLTLQVLLMHLQA